MKHHIYFWNLENLFDLEHSPRRPAYLQEELKDELEGWTEEVLEQKIENLTSIIKKMNNGAGPDVLGICEIENEYVVDKLKERINDSFENRNYQIAHKDTSDKRGIDIAIIFDKKRYNWDGKIWALEIIKRRATRDLFQIVLETKEGNNELILIGNHWPSRSGGELKSEPFRKMVAENLGYWVDNIHDIKGKEDKVASIVLMGDFNENPYNRSLIDYLRTSPTAQRVKNATTSNLMYNPMFQFVDEVQATYVFGGQPQVFDQFILSKSFLVKRNENPFWYDSVGVVKYPEMVKGDYDTPIRFSRPNKDDYNPQGYSDHLPIELIISEQID